MKARRVETAANEDSAMRRGRDRPEPATVMSHEMSRPHPSIQRAHLLRCPRATSW